MRPTPTRSRGEAVAALTRAGERASALAASLEAQRYFEQAAALAGDPLDQAGLLEQAGMMAREAGLSDDARIRFEEAVELFEAHGATHPAARVSARLGEVMWDTGRLREALERMDAALGLLAGEEADADVAALAAEVGRFRFFAGEPAIAAERIETALEMAESLGLPEVLSQAVNTKAMILSNRGRNGESGALVRYALEVALEHDIPSAAFRAYNNVADLEARSDRFEAAATGYRDGLALARRVGHRQQEWLFLGQTYPPFMLGLWDEALSVVGRSPRTSSARPGSRSSATSGTASRSSSTAASWRRPIGCAAASPSYSIPPTSASARRTAGPGRRCCSRRDARRRRWRSPRRPGSCVTPRASARRR